MTATKRPGFHDPVSIAPLVTFRIVFGLLMFFSLLRFWWRGWVTTVYVLPEFHFTYMGFEWVKPLGDTGTHLLFLLVATSSLFIALGFCYRMAAIVFFLGFTYIELIDVTTYLNHYYFISLVAFIMIWLPANRRYSLDTWRHPTMQRSYVPAWTIGLLKFQLAIVYVFAGLAKLNTDWLIHAEPMRTWLPSKSHLPIVGKYMYDGWVAHLFSWFGAAYDLFIVFFMMNKKTRPLAYCCVLIFHISTAIFFPAIGMFPYVMMACSLVFFSGHFHERLLGWLPFYKQGRLQPAGRSNYEFNKKGIFMYATAVYVLIQLLLPIRFLLYPGHLFWHEEGYRFSWRVMLMEKSGVAYFRIRDKQTGESLEVNNKQFLTPLQEKMMSTQPDMILKYAHYLEKNLKDWECRNLRCLLRYTFLSTANAPGYSLILPSTLQQNR